MQCQKQTQKLKHSEPETQYDSATAYSPQFVHKCLGKHSIPQVKQPPNLLDMAMTVP